MRPIKGWSIAFLVALSATAIISIPLWFGLRYVYSILYFWAMLCLLIAATGLLIMLARHLLKKRWTKAICWILICGLFFMIPSSVITYGSVRIGTNQRIATSPSGNHQLIIINNGLSVRSFSVYPMVNPWLYRNMTDNDIPYTVDKGAENVENVHVEWLSDMLAQVYYHRWQSVPISNSVYIQFADDSSTT